MLGLGLLFDMLLRLDYVLLVALGGGLCCGFGVVCGWWFVLICFDLWVAYGYRRQVYLLVGLRLFVLIVVGVCYVVLIVLFTIT